MNKHSYTCYAAVSKDGQSIFQRESSRDDDSGELLEWFDEWQFGLELVPDCAYMEGWQDILRRDLKNQNIDAQIKKFKITVEELGDCD